MFLSNVKNESSIHLKKFKLYVTRFAIYIIEMTFYIVGIWFGFKKGKRILAKIFFYFNFFFEKDGKGTVSTPLL